MGAIKTRDEAQSKLQALNEKMGQADTVGQLKIMVATLQKEISMLQANNTKLKESGERLDGALADAETSRAAHAKLVGRSCHAEHLGEGGRRQQRSLCRRGSEVTDCDGTFLQEAERGLLARKLKVLESNAKKFEAVKVELEDKAEDLRVRACRGTFYGLSCVPASWRDTGGLHHGLATTTALPPSMTQFLL